MGILKEGRREGGREGGREEEREEGREGGRERKGECECDNEVRKSKREEEVGGGNCQISLFK